MDYIENMVKIEIFLEEKAFLFCVITQQGIKIAHAF